MGWGDIRRIPGGFVGGMGAGPDREFVGQDPN
jgi:hypothetical protein